MSLRDASEREWTAVLRERVRLYEQHFAAQPGTPNLAEPDASANLTQRAFIPETKNVKDS